VPLYEYRCSRCNGRKTILTLRTGENIDTTCPRCDTPTLERQMSRFAMVRSEDARLDAMSDPSRFGDLDENDPKSMGRFVKQMGSDLGDELGGDALDEMVDRIEAGDGGDDDS